MQLAKVLANTDVSLGWVQYLFTNLYNLFMACHLDSQLKVFSRSRCSNQSNGPLHAQHELRYTFPHSISANLLCFLFNFSCQSVSDFFNLTSLYYSHLPTIKLHTISAIFRHDLKNIVLIISFHYKRFLVEYDIANKNLTFIYTKGEKYIYIN